MSILVWKRPGIAAAAGQTAEGLSLDWQSSVWHVWENFSPGFPQVDFGWRHHHFPYSRGKVPDGRYRRKR